MRKGSRISKANNNYNYALSSGRDSEIMCNVDDASIDEETDFANSHRFSIVKRYNIPTFFTPDKNTISQRIQHNQQVLSGIKQPAYSNSP